jgi:hypothetical protein
MDINDTYQKNTNFHGGDNETIIFIVMATIKFGDEK